MRFEEDVFDGVMQGDDQQLVPHMERLEGAIRSSLEETFDVEEFALRTRLVDQDSRYLTVRWAADCVDTSRDTRFQSRRPVTVHGLSMVDLEGAPDVIHYIDWARVMGQLGMATSRASAIAAQ